MAAYLDCSAGWQPIHLACAHRWPVERLKALLRGGADPRLRSAFCETPLQICTLADAAWGALPEDKPLLKVLREALRPWHPERHGLFPRSFTPSVVTVLLVHQRLERLAARHARTPTPLSHTRSGVVQQRPRRRLGAALRVRLPREVWLQCVVCFLPRFSAVA